MLQYGRQMSSGDTNLPQLMKLGLVSLVGFDMLRYLYILYKLLVSFSGLNIVEQSLWRAVPHYLRRLSNALKKVNLIDSAKFSFSLLPLYQF